MAGGKGERLKPLTNEIPKPMVKINGKPILEKIILNCQNSGFENFFLKRGRVGLLIFFLLV